MFNFQYDQEVEYQAIREEERAEGRQEGEYKKAIEMAKKMLSDKMSFIEIEKYTDLDLRTIEELSNS